VVSITHRPALANIADVVIHIEDGAVKAFVNAESTEIWKASPLSGTTGN
jgi:ABC-type protease/lipase transport system fused ATPase/permease subunit